jgi:DNA-binding NarL/FixJ family response regulator
VSGIAERIAHIARHSPSQHWITNHYAARSRQNYNGVAMHPSVLIADDHLQYASAIRSWLTPAYRVVGVAGDGQELVEMATREKPDLIVTDLSMPVMNGIDAMQALAENGTSSRIIVLSMHAEISLAVLAFRSGASAYILKIAMEEDLSPAMAAVQRDEFFLSPQFPCELGTILTEALGGAPSAVSSPLTHHQQRMLQFVDSCRRST